MRRQASILVTGQPDITTLENHRFYQGFVLFPVEADALHGHLGQPDSILAGESGAEIATGERSLGQRQAVLSVEADHGGGIESSGHGRRQVVGQIRVVCRQVDAAHIQLHGRGSGLYRQVALESGRLVPCSVNEQFQEALAVLFGGKVPDGQVDPVQVSPEPAPRNPVQEMDLSADALDERGIHFQLY